MPPVTPNAVEEAAGDARGDAKGDATEALGIIESQGARQGKNPLGWYEWYVFFWITTWIQTVLIAIGLVRNFE